MAHAPTSVDLTTGAQEPVISCVAGPFSGIGKLPTGQEFTTAGRGMWVFRALIDCSALRMPITRDMKVTESSESVLAGTKRPPFRLVCRVLGPDGARLRGVQPAVSEEFVVHISAPSMPPLHYRVSVTCSVCGACRDLVDIQAARLSCLHSNVVFMEDCSGTQTRTAAPVQETARTAGLDLWVSAAMAQVVTKRTKNLKKQEIPSLDDPISKLNHIGKETVKKLNELKASADEAQLHLPIPPELYRCGGCMPYCSMLNCGLLHETRRSRRPAL